MVHLPVTDVDVTLPAGNWTLRREGGQYPADRLTYLADGSEIYSGVTTTSIGCDAWLRKTQAGTLPVRVVPPPFRHAHLKVSNPGYTTNLCLDLARGSSLIVTAGHDDPDLPVHLDLLLRDLGVRALARWGRQESREAPPPGGGPPQPAPVDGLPPWFNPDLYSTFRLEGGVFGMVSAGEPAIGGYFGLSMFFPGVSRSSEFGFAHGGRVHLGYAEYDQGYADLWYGLGFAARLSTMTLSLRAGAGLDVIGSGAASPTFVLPFAFTVGPDLSFRGWVTPGFGLELGGQYLRRFPDEMSLDARNEVRAAFSVLVGLNRGPVRSAKAGPTIALTGHYTLFANDAFDPLGHWVGGALGVGM